MDGYPLLVEKEEKVNFVYDFLVDSTHTMLVLVDAQTSGSGKTMAVDEAICLLEKKYGPSIFQCFKAHHFADDQKFVLYNTVTGQLKIISYVAVWNDAWSYIVRDWEAKVAVFKYDGHLPGTFWETKSTVFKIAARDDIKP